MKNIKRMMAAFMAMVLLFSAAGGALMAAAEENAQEKWEENVLVKDPFAVFGVDPELIGAVTFQDNLENVPEVAWNMGMYGPETVKAWFQWEEKGGHVFFAADGGINGKECTKALFKDLKNLKEVNFGGAFHTEQAESMEEMFYNCRSLEAVDAATLNTQNVESMYRMFTKCRELKELDLSGFDTAKVTTMGHMFSGCKKLETVKVSGWNTEKVKNMEAMFENCWLLEDLDLTGWNVESVHYYNGFLDWNKTINGEAWYKFFR